MPKTGLEPACSNEQQDFSYNWKTGQYSMKDLNQCIQDCEIRVSQDSNGHDIYVIRSPEGHTSIVSSHHLTHEKAKYLCSKV